MTAREKKARDTPRVLMWRYADNFLAVKVVVRPRVNGVLEQRDDCRG